LIGGIWTDTIVEESNLQHYLHVLRKTLGTRRDGKPFIETFRRRGYRFTAEVNLIKDFQSPKIDRNVSLPVFEPKMPPEVWKNSDLNDFGSNIYEAELPEGGKMPEMLRSRRINLAVVLTVLFVLATVLYFQFQPPVTNSRSNVAGEISVTPLTSGQMVLSATISPDGKYFAYHESDALNTHLWLQQTGQTSRIEIIPAGERVVSGKTFTPKSDFVYFVSQEKGESNGALYRIPTLGGTTTKILNNIYSPVSFSPDGREMVFVRKDEKKGEFQLIIAPAEGGEERVLLASAGEEELSTGAAWSPDGKFIAYEVLNKTITSGEGSCSLAAVELETGVSKIISPEKWDTCFRMAWSPDGDGMFFVGTRAGESFTTRRDQVYYLSVATGQSRAVTTDGSRYQDMSLGVTANNSLIAVPSKRLSQIWVMDASGDSRTAVQLTNGQADGRSGIAPVADGRVGYISRVGENLSVWLMNADGSGQRQISDQMPSVEELRATPDGRFFIFSARRDGFSHLYRIDVDGGNLKQLTAGESGEVDSTVSPDSRWVYYCSLFRVPGRWKTELRKTAIESGETVVLKDLEALQPVPHISPDGKVISAFDNEKIKLLSAIDGTALDSLEIDKMAQMSTGAKWTPDGQALTYLVYRDDGVNVWIQPISKPPPRPLTDFSKGYVYFHAFSRDGTKLYVARGYQLRDPVLIRNWR
jgi:Tol biopolymer transport system component